MMISEILGCDKGFLGQKCFLHSQKRVNKSRTELEMSAFFG